MDYGLITQTTEPDADAVEVRQMAGEKYLVAPVVAVSEGVLNGGFLPFEEIQASAPAWNGEPVTVTHPSDENGDFLPASGDESTVERYTFGRLLNVEADAEGRKLDGELWVSLSKAKWLIQNDDELGELAELAIEKLRGGERLEVSTGYWHGSIDEAGEFQGNEFDRVQTDVLPDHLATLPTNEGACNWSGDRTASGCGAPRANAFDLSAIDVDTPDVNRLRSNEAIRDSVERASFDGSTQAIENFDVGDRVAWEASGGEAYGTIVELRETGDDPLDDEIDGDVTVDPPAAQIEVFQPDPEEGEWVGSGTMVGHRVDTDTLSKIDSFPSDELQSLVESRRLAYHATATNLLDEARVPDFDGTTSSEWSGPNLGDYVDAMGLDAETVGDLSDDMAQAIAEKSLLGDAMADTFSELVFFPVVEPSTDELSESALEAVISGRGAQADISDDQLASARRVAYELLNDPELFDRGLDVPDELASNAIGNEALSDPFGGSKNTLSWQHMDTNHDYDDDTLEAIAQSTDLSVEELRDAPKQYVDALESNLDSDSGSCNCGSGATAEKVEALESQVDELREELDAQKTERRDELIETITANSRFDEDDLEALEVADDVEKLETFAEKQSIQTNTTTPPARRTGPTGQSGPSPDDIDVSGPVTGGSD